MNYPKKYQSRTLDKNTFRIEKYYISLFNFEIAEN